MSTNRRPPMRMASAAAMDAALPDSIGKALAVTAAARTGPIQDLEHIVIPLQDNRTFDQYCGSLKGVRGFNDSRVVTLPNGIRPWAQQTGSTSLLPCNPPGPNAELTFHQDVPHGWNDSQRTWNGGKYDA